MASTVAAGQTVLASRLLHTQYGTLQPYLLSLPKVSESLLLQSRDKGSGQKLPNLH